MVAAKMKRLSKLHRDAAMLCSAYATVCADDSWANWTSSDELLGALGVTLEADRLASRALEVCVWEFIISTRNSDRSSRSAMHWALAASVLLNGEVS